MGIIDFDMRDRGFVYYTAIILVVIGHGVHFTTSDKLTTAFQITLLMGWSLLLVSEVRRTGRIHVSTLLYRSALIAIIALIVVPKI